MEENFLVKSAIESTEKQNRLAINKRKREHYLENRERLLGKVKSYYEKDKERILDYQTSYYRKNADYVKARGRTYAIQNKDKVYGYEAKRRARKIEATPSWFSELDEFVITEAFDLARQRGSETGVAWHVDHVVPLKSKVVCGLHTADNIQVLPAVINMQKSNKWPHSIYFGMGAVNSLRSSNTMEKK